MRKTLRNATLGAAVLLVLGGIVRAAGTPATKPAQGAMTSAAATLLSVGLMLAGDSAFASDMAKKDAMAKDEMKKGATAKDPMAKDPMKKESVARPGSIRGWRMDRAGSPFAS